MPLIFSCMSHALELSAESSIDSLSEDQRIAVEDILNNVREACLRVAPPTEIDEAISTARLRILQILDVVPSDIESSLRLHEALITKIYERRHCINQSLKNGFLLDSPNFIESHMNLIAPSFDLTPEEVEKLTKNLRNDITGRKSSKRRRAKKINKK